MLCISSLFVKYRKLSRIFLENFKNSILTIFVPLTIIENIGSYPTLINFILFRQMAYQLICVANKFLRRMRRIIQILRAATDGCRSWPCLAGPPPHGALNCRCSQTLALFFTHCNAGNFVNIPVHVNKTTLRH